MTVMSLRGVSLAVTFVALRLASAQDQQANFNQVVNLNGDMELNRIAFPDNSRVETFSQTQRQLIVNQNQPPLPASNVVGSTGEPFVQLSPMSMTIQTNQANDLVGGEVIMPIDPALLQQTQINPDNTFVAKLSPDRQSWVIMEKEKTVREAEGNVRMVRMTNIDGEYIVVGRQTAETGAALTAFGGADANNVVQIEGSGIQEVEFQDGFRMSIRASQPMTVQADVVNGVSANMIVSGTQPVNSYRYLVTSNLGGVQPDLNQMVAVVQLPLNAERVMQTAEQMGAGPDDAIALSIEQRAVLQNPGGAVGQQLQPPAGQQAPQRRQEAEQPQDGQQPPQQGQAPPQEQQPPQDQQPSPPQQQQPPAATQLLLEPTFTPIAAQTLVDAEGGRIAVPVDQVDGEFILVMEMAGRAQPGQPGRVPGAQPPPAQGEIPEQARPVPPGRPEDIPGQAPEQPQAPESSDAPIGGVLSMVPIEPELPGAEPPAAPPAAPQQPQQPQRPQPVPNGGVSQQPSKRQEQSGRGSIVMSMSELRAMMMRQQAGDAWVGVMLDEYVSERSGQPVPDRQAQQTHSGTPTQEQPAQMTRISGEKLRRTSRRVSLSL